MMIAYKSEKICGPVRAKAKANPEAVILFLSNNCLSFLIIWSHCNLYCFKICRWLDGRYISVLKFWMLCPPGWELCENHRAKRRRHSRYSLLWTHWKPLCCPTTHGKGNTSFTCSKKSYLKAVHFSSKSCFSSVKKEFLCSDYIQST